ncbi:uncharacterized protein LOC128397784 [Panonychus citri]|uniref:uncharacterized protein LOC128389168 n=1 Tax=Panonychus citri TaxID=50023 RepID=UPI002307C5AE|nr:uncharacterized protein LOC128389168 [Panonychus citri]XP_053214511.1 uncharacterized protein LOC128397784 [Panonychus citri]
MVENIHDQIEELKRKKVILSELDATGIVLRKVVDTIDTMYDFIREKYRITHSSSYKVPIDKTFKVKEKVFQFNLFIASMKLTILINFFQNQIFIEGLLELPLDKYKNALRLAKPNAPAIGYQIIKTAFPESYYKNVTLGKKSYKNEQLHSYKFVTNGGENSTSVPLAFVFAFADPFSKPYEGEIDPELGQSRINSFQDHIFRRSGVEEYTEKELNDVRQRLIRILGSLNRKSKSTEDSDPEDGEEGNDLEDQDEDEQSGVYSKSFDLDILEDIQT